VEILRKTEAIFLKLTNIKSTFFIKKLIISQHFSVKIASQTQKTFYILKKVFFSYKKQTGF